MSGLGDALIALGKGAADTGAAYQTSIDDAQKRQLLMRQQQRQDMLDALSARVTNAQLAEYDQKTSDRKTEADQKNALYAGGTDTLAKFVEAQRQQQQGKNDEALYGQIKGVPESMGSLAMTKPSPGLFGGTMETTAPHTNLRTGVTQGAYDENGEPVLGSQGNADSAERAKAAGAGIAETAQQMATARQRLGQSRLGMLQGAGGLQFGNDPRVKDAMDFEQNAEENAATARAKAEENRLTMENSNYQKELDRQNRTDNLTIADRSRKDLLADKQVDQSDIDYLAGEVRHGRMAPNDLRTYLPAGLVGGKARTDVLKKASEMYKQDNPNDDLDASRLSRDYNNFKSANTTKALQAVETFLPNLDKLQAALEQLPPGAPVKSLNAILQKGQVQFGGQAATNVSMLKGVLSSELGSSLGGGSALSDFRVKEALNALNTDAPKEAALASLDALRKVEVNRHVNVALQGGVYGEQYLRDIYGEETANQLIAEEKAAKQKVGKSALAGHSTPAQPAESGAYSGLDHGPSANPVNVGDQAPAQPSTIKSKSGHVYSY